MKTSMNLDKVENKKKDKKIMKEAHEMRPLFLVIKNFIK